MVNVWLVVLGLLVAATAFALVYKPRGQSKNG